MPAYLYPENAARALGHAVRYSGWRSKDEGQVPELTGIRQHDAQQLIARFLAKQHLGGWLPPDQAARLLACYGIMLVPTIEARDADAAGTAASPLRNVPVVLKAESAGLGPKREAGARLPDLRGEQGGRR